MYLARAVDQSWNPQWQRLGLTTHLAPGDADLPARLTSAGPPAARRFISATALTLPALPRGKRTAPSTRTSKLVGISRSRDRICARICARDLADRVGTKKTA